MSQGGIRPSGSDFVDGRVKVNVRVIKAVDLRYEGKDPSKLNPFVSVKLGSDETQKHKTNIIKNDPNPVWDETFTYRVKDLESELIFVKVKSKDKIKNIQITKPIKISFLSFHYGETKEVEKELHLKDQYVGKLYLQISLQEKADKKSPRKSKPSGLCFRVRAVEGKELEDDSNYAVQLKMDVDDTSNPITASKPGPNPVWNEDLYIKTSDSKKDTLKVILLKDDKKCIESVKIDTAAYSVGQEDVTFDDDVYNQKKQKVGHLKLIITPLDYNTNTGDDTKYDLNVNLIDSTGYSRDDEPLTCDLQINGKSIVTSKGSSNFKWNESFTIPFNNLQKDVFTIKPSKGDGIAIFLSSLKMGELKEFKEEVPGTDDCEIHFTLQPGDHVRTRAINLGDEGCDEFSLGNFSSTFSTDFDSLSSSELHSLSDLRASEDANHNHSHVKVKTEIKPFRCDNVIGSLKSLSDLADVDGDSQVYVTMDLLSYGLNKKAKTKESNKVAPGETPEMPFNFNHIKKGNTLVFNVWKTVSGGDPESIGRIEIPVKDIPNDQNELTREIAKPQNYTGRASSFGTATFDVTHTVDYEMPPKPEDVEEDEDDDEDDDDNEDEE